MIKGSHLRTRRLYGIEQPNTDATRARGEARGEEGPADGRPPRDTGPQGFTLCGLQKSRQPHLALLASEKVLTAPTTPETSAATAAICAVVGLSGRAFTSADSVSTDDEIALVSLGKSLLAESTSAVVSLWIVVSCACRSSDLVA